jgi:acetyltransferase-like isoleucine patch superfamily enzyme
MQAIRTRLIQLIFYIKATLFYLFNFIFFKKIEFRSVVYKPAKIEGKQFISLYKNVKINSYSWLIALKIDEFEPELIFHEGCNIGDFNHIAAVRRVVFGKNVLTANRVYISDNLHGYDDISKPIMHQPVKFKSEVIIGDGSWIGENVCIIGANIGKNCVIGANSVVTVDIPDYSVAVGIPAVVIKRYDHSSRSWKKTNG